LEKDELPNAEVALEILGKVSAASVHNAISKFVLAEYIKMNTNFSF